MMSLNFFTTVMTEYESKSDANNHEQFRVP